MYKSLVAVLVGLIALGTFNFVNAVAPGTIQNVFVTNWPRNQNVTVTNPPVINLNVTASKPVLNLKGGGAVQSVTTQHPSSTNFTFAVRGYRDLVLGVHLDAGPSAFINQTQYNATTPAGPGTVTLYNLSYTNWNIYYSSGPVAGLDTSPQTFPFGQFQCGSVLTDQSPVSDSPCFVWGTVPDRYTNYRITTVIVDGLRPLGPNLTAYVYFFSYVVSGYYFNDCSPLVRNSPPTDCLSGGLWGGQFGRTQASATVNAPVTVYATG